jgi:hypothetical protein
MVGADQIAGIVEDELIRADTQRATHVRTYIVIGNDRVAGSQQRDAGSRFRVFQEYILARIRVDIAHLA